jgi:hypothetical protein
MDEETIQLRVDFSTEVQQTGLVYLLYIVRVQA